MNYELTEEEKSIIKEAFREGIKDTIKDFFDTYYNGSIWTEEEIRLRLYHNIAKLLEKYPNNKNLISSIESEERGIKHGGLDLIVENPICRAIEYEKRKIIIAVEMKFKSFSRSRRYYLSGNNNLENDTREDIKKLKDEGKENPDAVLYYLFFHSLDYPSKENEEYTAKVGEEIFNKKLSGTNIKFVFVTCWQGIEIGETCPYSNAGVIKSNDKFFEKENEPKNLNQLP